MNGFTKKRVGTMTLGERLMKLRSDRRISIAEVSRSTRIRADYIEKLESGDYDHLPADVYVKGFLRSYAEFFGVEEKIFIRLFEKEKGIRKNIEKSRSGPDDGRATVKPINISSFVFTPKKIALTVAGLLLLSAAVYVYRSIGSFASTPRLVISGPTDNQEVHGNSVFVEGFTDKDNRLYINNQPILVNEDGKFRENITLQPGVNTINVRSVSRFDKESVESLQVRADYEERVAGADDDTAAEGEAADPADEKTEKDLEIELTVDPGPVWVQAEADGNLVFSGTVLSGATQVFHAKDKIVMSSGRANATFVKFNGKSVGPLGPEPKAVQGVTFTKDTKY
jgi:hypothetical protein